MQIPLVALSLGLCLLGGIALQVWCIWKRRRGDWLSNRPTAGGRAAVQRAQAGCLALLGARDSSSDMLGMPSLALAAPSHASLSKLGCDRVCTSYA